MGIPYGRHSIDAQDVEAVSRALTSEYLTTGPLVEQFEQKICELVGVKHCIAVSSGTAALHLICRARDMGPADLGVTSPITFAASSNCFEYCGARSDFIDIDAQTVNISPEEVRRYCEEIEPPATVVAVSFAGIPADLPQLRELSRRYGFFLIEDAAHSLGSTYTADGKIYRSGSCSHSDAAIFSFHPVKTITTGEGGAVVTNNDELAERVRLLRSHGIKRDVPSQAQAPWYYEMRELGFHYRITDLQCALGLSQLERLTEFATRRREIVARYNDHLCKVEQVSIPCIPTGIVACPHLYVVQFTEGSDRRLQAYKALLTKGVHTQVHYIPVYWHPYYDQRYGYARGKCLRAECYYQQCLSLPLYVGLRDEEVDLVCEVLLQTLTQPLS